MALSIDVEQLLRVAKQEHSDYLENDRVPAGQMLLEKEQHERGLCFATCFFCKLDRTMESEVLAQLISHSKNITK